MAPSVELSSTTFARLQTHAIPLTDTIESVINRIIDAYEKKNDVAGAANGSGGNDGQSVRAFNPGAPPNLTYAKVLGVSFCGKPLVDGQDNWNGMLTALVREAKTKSKSPDEFKKLMVVNFVDGVKLDKGYRPLLDLGISVQGQDANGAWRGVCHIAQQLGCSLSVKFAWQEKEGAAYPGVTGQLTVPGSP